MVKTTFSHTVLDFPASDLDPASQLPAIQNRTWPLASCNNGKTLPGIVALADGTHRGSQSQNGHLHSSRSGPTGLFLTILGDLTLYLTRPGAEVTRCSSNRPLGNIEP